MMQVNYATPPSEGLISLLEGDVNSVKSALEIISRNPPPDVAPLCPSLVRLSNRPCKDWPSAHRNDGTLPSSTIGDDVIEIFLQDVPKVIAILAGRLQDANNDPEKLQFAEVLDKLHARIVREQHGNRRSELTPSRLAIVSIFRDYSSSSSSSLELIFGRCVEREARLIRS